VQTCLKSQSIIGQKCNFEITQSLSDLTRWTS